MTSLPESAFPYGPEGPFLDAAEVTPDDAADLPQPGYLWANTAGAVSVVTVRGTTLTVQLPAGGVLPVMVRRVRATGTTATVLLMR